MNENTLLHTARQALHAGPAIPDSVFDALHAEAAAAARHRRRFRLRLRLLSAAGIAALLVLALVPSPHRHSDEIDADSRVANALELLLLDEYGDTSEEGLAAADMLLLFQECPGYL